LPPAFIGPRIARQPYSIVSHEDAQAGQRVFRVKIAEEVPPMWGAIIGDIVHNLRASLDLLINELVFAAGNQPHRLTQFPIGAEVKDLKPAFFNKIKGTKPTVAALIKRLKPYQGGTQAGEALWRLHELDIRDKHRLLVPVGAANPGIVMRMRMTGFGGREVEFPAFGLNASDRQFPLKDGAEVYREPLAGLGPTMKADVEARFEVAFGEGQIFDGEPLSPTFDQLIQLVERVVGVFERYCS
jgi:hypothetical protein